MEKGPFVPQAGPEPLASVADGRPRMDGLLSGLPWGVTVTKAPAGRTTVRWWPRDVCCCCAPLLPGPWSLLRPAAAPPPRTAPLTPATWSQQLTQLRPHRQALPSVHCSQSWRSKPEVRGSVEGGSGGDPLRLLGSSLRRGGGLCFGKDTNSTAGRALLTSFAPNHLPEAPRPDTPWWLQRTQFRPQRAPHQIRTAGSTPGSGTQTNLKPGPAPPSSACTTPLRQGGNPFSATPIPGSAHSRCHINARCEEWVNS